MAAQDFIQQLRDLGYKVAEKGEGRVVFPYTVPVGKFEGKEIMLGFIVPLLVAIALIARTWAKRAKALEASDQPRSAQSAQSLGS